MLSLIEIRRKISELEEELENLKELETKTNDKIGFIGIELGMVTTIGEESMVLVDCDMERLYCRTINEDNALDYGLLNTIPVAKFIAGTKYKKYSTLFIKP